MKTKIVRVEMIDLSVKLYVGKKEEIVQKLRKIRPEFNRSMYGLNKKGERCSYDIFIIEDQKQHSVTSILVHEITHVVDKALTNRGASGEKEFRAFLSGYLFEEFEKFLNKIKIEKEGI